MSMWLNPDIDRTPSHMREVPETITCACGAVVVENKMTKELVHLGPCLIGEG